MNKSTGIKVKGVGIRNVNNRTNVSQLMQQSQLHVSGKGVDQMSNYRDPKERKSRCQSSYASMKSMKQHWARPNENESNLSS